MLISNEIDLVRSSRRLTPWRRVARPALLVGLLVAGLLALTAVPAGAAPTPEAWTGKVCTSLDQWVTALGDRAAAATEKLPTGVKATQKALVGLLKQAETDSKKLATQLGKAGKPSGADGKAVAKTVRDVAAQATKTITAARKTVQKITTTEPAAFAAQAHGAEDTFENTLERLEGIFGSASPLDQQPWLGAFTQASTCQKLNDELTTISTEGPSGSKVDIGSLSPGSGPAGTVTTLEFAGVGPAESTACQESSAYRSEFLGSDGALLSLGSADVRVPDGAPAGVSTIRVVCYFPDVSGRPLMRSLCGSFEVTSSGPSGPRATNVGVACPPTGRVVGGDAIIATQRALGGTFDALLQPLG